MAQFRTTADIVDLALRNAGEVTNGNSPYESQTLDYLNRVHMAIVSGGTIPVGKDQTIEIDEVWLWAKEASPLILDLVVKHDTGTVNLTQGSEAGTFSSAPSASLEGWFFRVDGREEVLRIAQHTAASTAFEINGPYPDATGATLSYEAFKLDYDLIPDYITIDSRSNKLDFKKTSAGSELTATLTAGVYTPSALATHVATVMTTAASGPTITGAYSALTRKFSFTSDGAGSTTLLPLFATGTNQGISAHKKLGFDDEDIAAALTHTSTYVLGGISRLIEPFKIHKGTGDGVFGIDPESFSRDFPLVSIGEGTPTRFTVIGERPDGTFTVRFNRYPKDRTRVEVERIAVPRDLKDNAGSIPLVPRKHVDALEDAATFYIMLHKSDDRAQVYANLLQGKLKAMIAQNRGAQARFGQHFGQIISRADLAIRRRRIFPTEPY